MAKICSLLWTISCIAGLIIQIVIVSQQYFSYSTSSGVTVSNKQQSLEDIPGLTFCLEFYYMIKLDLIKADYNCSVTNPFSSLDKCKIKFTPANILRYTKFPRSFRELKEKYLYFVDSYRKCSTSLFSPSLEARSQRLVGGLNIRNLFSFKNSREPVKIYLHDRRAPIYGFDNLEEKEIIQDTQTENRITYTLYKTIRPSTLTYPCINYTETPFFTSRDHCIHQCRLFQKDESSRSFVFYNDSSDFNPKMYPGIKRCDECPQDCIELMYTFSIMKNLFQHPFDLAVSLYDTVPMVEIQFSVQLHSWNTSFT